MWRLPRAVTFLVSRCHKRASLPFRCSRRLTREDTEDHNKISTTVQEDFMNSSVTRRTFATRVAAVLSTLGIASSVLLKGASAQTSGGQNSAAQNSMAPDASGIRKMNAEGKPGGEKDVIMPVIIHNGLIYVSGQGAHDTRDPKEWTIESHTTMVMDKIKKMVEIGGGTMETVLQTRVFLVNIEHWEAM